MYSSSGITVLISLKASTNLGLGLPSTLLFSFNNGTLIKNWKFDTFSELTIYTVIFFCIIWFIISIMKEQEINVREFISTKPLPVRWAIYILLILSVPFFQAANMVGFIYAQF